MHKIGTGILVLFFVFVATYTPIPQTNNVPEAEAAGAFGKVTDLYNGAINTGTMIYTAMSAGLDTITANAAALGLTKESWLDSVAWGLAKSVVSEMASSIVDWINNGFQGSPAFVQDLEGFLLNVADKEFGSYLEKLGGPLSMLCSPFKLDIQIALALDYSKKRADDTSCRLSDALENLGDFVEGNFDRGGWAAWFEVTANPTDYTKYGSYMNAQAGAAISITGQQDKEEKLIAFGGGFLSAKVCDTVETVDGRTQEKCSVSTPGKIIQEALSFNLDSGRQSLIQADEANEIIAALFGQLAKQAITGAAGLLGLSDDTGYTTYVYDPVTMATSSVASGARAQTTLNEHNIAQKLAEAIALEEFFYERSVSVALPRLLAYASPNSGADAYRRSLATDEARRILDHFEPEIRTLLVRLYELDTRLRALPPPEQDTPLSKRQREQIIRDYSGLKLHNKEFVDATLLSWDRIYRNVNNGEAQQNAEYEARASGLIENAVRNANEDEDNEEEGRGAGDDSGDSGSGSGDSSDSGATGTESEALGMAQEAVAQLGEAAALGIAAGALGLGEAISDGISAIGDAFGFGDGDSGDSGDGGDSTGE